MNSEWNSETAWELRPQHALQTRAHLGSHLGSHLRQHLAELLAARKLLQAEVVTDRVVVQARSKIDAWVLAASSSSNSAPEFQRRPHSEHRKAEHVLQVELEVLAKQEKVAAEQEMLRATAEKNTKPKKAKENILIGWGKG